MIKKLLYFFIFFVLNIVQGKDLTLLTPHPKKDFFTLNQDPPNIKEQYLQAVGAFEKLESNGNFTDVINPNQLTELPIGIKEDKNSVEYAIVVTKARFTPEFALVDVFARVRTPQQGLEGGKKDLYFGAEGVKLSYNGNIIGDAKLSLLGDVHIPFNQNKWLLTLQGGEINKSTGNIHNSNTYVTIDCNGIKDLSLKGSIQISREILVPIDKESGKLASEHILIGSKSVVNRVRGDFEIKASDWNDLLVKVNISPFAITSQTQNKDKGYFTFYVNTAVLDLSDLRNDQSVIFPNYYLEQGYLIAGEQSWRGLFIETLEVGLPQEFKISKNANKPVQLAAKHLIIDNYGVSGRFSANNIFPIDEGITSNKGGWAYSLDKIGVDLAASKIVGANLEGQIKLPIQNQNKNNVHLSYKGIITDEEYLLTTKLNNNLDFDIWKAKATIHSSSYIELKVKERRFLPKAVLNGEMSIAANQKENNSTESTPNDKKTLAFSGITFQELVLQTESPLFSVKHFGVRGEQKIANFPASIKDIILTSDGQNTNLQFGITIGLQDKGFSASGILEILGKIESEQSVQKWKYNGFNLSKLELKNVDVGVAKLSGSLHLMDNDPTYGKGFRANLDAQINAISDVKIGVTAIFGRTTFRYWGFEGNVNNLNVPTLGITIKGFTGGAFYRMLPHPASNSAMAFTPNEKVGLNLRANVYGAIKDEKIANMMAGFHISTNPNGGIANIGFMGEAFIMQNLEASIPYPFAKIQEKFTKTIGENKFINDIVNTERLEKVLDTKNIDDYYPTSINEDTPIYSKIAMDYDFNNKVFHAELDVFVNAPGGLIRGSGNNGRAGWAVLHIAPKEWYLHIGTPSDRVGLKMGIGRFSVESTNYFMVGNRIPASPPPPMEVANILGTEMKDLDYMRDLNALGEGKGFAFGSHFKFDTGDMTALILYANFQAGIGADIMLKNYGEARCSNRGGKHIGFNGWYANGQAYAYLQGELGIKIKLFFIRKKIPIIKAGAATLLQVKAPNPFWMRGYLGGYYELLGGLVKGRFRFKLEFGEECKLENNEAVLDGMKIITDVTPKKEDKNVDVFAIPQATFAFKVNEPIVIPEDDGDHTYKIIVDKFTVTDENGKEIKGKVEFGNTADVANFVSDDILPPNKKLKATVEVSFMEKKNGLFQVINVNGVKAVEKEERIFTTGTAPNNIPLNNILYAYPVVKQQNYYTKESDKGYIKLKKGQDYLFDDPNWKTLIQFKNDKNKIQEVEVKYSDSDNTLHFTTPNFDKETNYNLNIVAKNNFAKNSNSNVSTNVSVSDLPAQDNEESQISSNITKKEAKEISKEGEIIRLNFAFRTSKYNTLERKLEALRFKTVRNFISSGIVYLENHINTDEYFDETELVGSPYTNNKPLINVTATMEDSFADKFKKLIYNHYPIENIRLDRENDSKNNVGIPPIKAVPISSSYLTFLTNQPENNLLKTLFPYQYDLFRYYSNDRYEILSKVVNKYIDSSFEQRPSIINEIISSDFGIIPSENYKINVQYTLPNSQKGTHKLIDYKINK